MCKFVGYLFFGRVEFINNYAHHIDQSLVETHTKNE